MRIDKLLWFLRLAKSRSIAQAMVAEGHMRLNGRRIERCHVRVAAGDMLALPHPAGVLVIELTALPIRRGPAPEAKSCYRVLDERGANLIAAAHYQGNEGDLQP